MYTAQTYYAFGSSMPGLAYQHDSADGYRFGFNNQERESGLGDYYAFEYRIHDARLGRFLSMDPLAFGYPWNSPYAFAENRVIDGIDLEGLEHYYSADGKKLNEAEVRSLNFGDAENAKTLTFDENSDEAYKVGIFVGPAKPGEKGVSSLTKLSITNNDLLSWAGWVNNETHTTESGGSMGEKYALAYAIRNWAEGGKITVSKKLSSVLDKKDYIKKNGKTFRENYKSLLNATNTTNKNLAIAAALNAACSGFDYSYGATQWDGIEQANSDGSVCNGAWEYHAASLGWTISDEHYKTWKNSITKFTKSSAYFKAPQHSLAKSCAASYNQNLMRLKSSARYGTTIFWKVRSAENSKQKHNGKNDSN